MISSTTNLPNRRASLAREQSLRRSFMAIHSPNITNFEESMPRLSSPVDGGAPDTTTTPGGGRRRRSVTPPAVTAVSHERMPSLPFGGDDDMSDEKQKRRLSRERPPSTKKKFARRSSAAITADVAQEMVTKIANEKRQEQQRSSRAASNIIDCSSSKPKRRVSVEAQHHQGFRRDYILGDAVRCPSHMIASPTYQDIASIQKHDFAFIKRSDGSFSYAILAFRVSESIKGNHNGASEECMTFVINETGSTKVIRERHWCQFIRPVMEESSAISRPHSPVAVAVAPTFIPTLEQQLNDVPYCQEVYPDESEDVVPDMIAFDPAEVCNEECSLISSVSEKARMIRRRC